MRGTRTRRMDLQGLSTHELIEVTDGARRELVGAPARLGARGRRDQLHAAARDEEDGVARGGAHDNHVGGQVHLEPLRRPHATPAWHVARSGARGSSLVWCECRSVRARLGGAWRAAGGVRLAARCPVPVLRRPVRFSRTAGVPCRSRPAACLGAAGRSRPMPSAR